MFLYAMPKKQVHAGISGTDVGCKGITAHAGAVQTLVWGWLDEQMAE